LFVQMIITSTHNEKLKEVRRLARSARARSSGGRFVAEGEDLVAAAEAAGWPALERYCVAGSGLGGVEVEPRVLASVSGLGSGTRVLGVYSERWAPAAVGPLCVYLHGVGDPGNVGAVLRSAGAFGASCVAIGEGTADPFGPKAVRASMGAIFAVPVVRTSAFEGGLAGELVALVPGAGDELMRFASTPRMRNATVRELTLLIGSERDGLPEELVGRADQIVHIPIQSQSLNAAMAATVALYELTRRMARE
jgi:TrmH family RNA methyltransferase